jgi:hypothetical protein
MRRFLLLLSVVSLAASAFVIPVSANSPVVAYTFTVTDLGQGCWGGGSLNTNGTISGGASCSMENGQIVGLIQGTNWQNVGGDAVELCFNFVNFKGVIPLPPCFGPIPVSGTPLIVSFPGSDNPTLIRVTPAN